MKEYINKYWMLSYDTKVFGSHFRGLRVLNTLTYLLCVGGLYNLFALGFDIWQGLSLVPFVAVAVYTGRYVITSKDLPYLDWEQELQLAQKPEYAKKKWDFVIPKYKEKELLDIHNKKYKGPEKFVHPWRFFFAFLVIIITCIIWGIWGFNEPGFPELRGF